MQMNRRQTNLNSLRMFDTAAGRLNFRLAAEDLNLTQGAVAQQVRNLESDLGVKLFLREARGLKLTDEGKRYHHQISRALALIDAATSELRQVDYGVTLSLPPSLASKWLVPRLAGFSRLHPDIEIRTVASVEISTFRNDGVDIAIRQGRLPTGDDLQIDRLAPLDLRAVCSPDMAKTMHPVSSLGDFSDLKLIQDGHNHWKTLFTKAGLAVPDRLVQFNQTALATEAAAGGQGIALSPRLLIQSDIEAGRLVDVWCPPAEPDTGFFIVLPTGGGRRMVACEKVRDWLLAEVNDG